MTKTKQFFLGYTSAGKNEQGNDPVKDRTIFIQGNFFTPEDNFLYIKNIFMKVEYLPLYSEMYQLFQPDNSNNIKAETAKLYKFYKIDQHISKSPGNGVEGFYFKYKTGNNPICMTKDEDDNLNKEINGSPLGEEVDFIVKTNRNNTYYSVSSNLIINNPNKYTGWEIETEPKTNPDNTTQVIKDNNGAIQNVIAHYKREEIPINYTSEGWDILKNFKFYLNDDRRHPIYPFMDGQKLFQFEANNEVQKIFSLKFDTASIYNIIGYPKYKKFENVQNAQKAGEYYSRGRLRLTLIYEASE